MAKVAKVAAARAFRRVRLLFMVVITDCP